MLLAGELHASCSTALRVAMKVQSAMFTLVTSVPRMPEVVLVCRSMHDACLMGLREVRATMCAHVEALGAGTVLE
jgi:hypothetical protein